MGFRNPIVGEETLIRNAIRSENYEPGVAGWIIKRNGFAEFLDVIIRGTLQSLNYVPGVSGWKLDQTGLAEFAEIIINSFGLQGKVEIRDGELRIYDTDDLLRILLTNNGNNAKPSVRMFDAIGNAVISLDTDDGFGSELPRLHLFDPLSQAYVSHQILVDDSSAGFLLGPPAAGEVWTPGRILSSTLGGAAATRLVSPKLAAGTGQSIFSLYGDDASGDTLGPRRASLEADVFYVGGAGGLTPGVINADSMRAFRDEITASTTTGSTTFVVTSGPGPSITIPTPKSGYLKFKCMAAMSNSVAGNPAIMGVEVRENNAAGSLIRAASDVDSLVRSTVTTGVSGEDIVFLLATGAANIFVRCMYRIATGGTGTFANRRLIVEASM